MSNYTLILQTMEADHFYLDQLTQLATQLTRSGHHVTVFTPNKIENWQVSGILSQQIPRSYECRPQHWRKRLRQLSLDSHLIFIGTLSELNTLFYYRKEIGDCYSFITLDIECSRQQTVSKLLRKKFPLLFSPFRHSYSAKLRKRFRPYPLLLSSQQSPDYELVKNEILQLLEQELKQGPKASSSKFSSIWAFTLSDSLQSQSLKIIRSFEFMLRQLNNPALLLVIADSEFIGNDVIKRVSQNDCSIHFITPANATLYQRVLETLPQIVHYYIVNGQQGEFPWRAYQVAQHGGKVISIEGPRFAGLIGSKHLMRIKSAFRVSVDDDFDFGIMDELDLKNKMLKLAKSLDKRLPVKAQRTRPAKNLKLEKNYSPSELPSPAILALAKCLEREFITHQKARSISGPPISASSIQLQGSLQVLTYKNSDRIKSSDADFVAILPPLLNSNDENVKLAIARYHSYMQENTDCAMAVIPIICQQSVQQGHLNSEFEKFLETWLQFGLVIIRNRLFPYRSHSHLNAINFSLPGHTLALDTFLRMKVLGKKVLLCEDASIKLEKLSLKSDYLKTIANSLHDCYGAWEALSRELDYPEFVRNSFVHAQAAEQTFHQSVQNEVVLKHLVSMKMISGELNEK
jgi:hypothetical protein